MSLSPREAKVKVSHCLSSSLCKIIQKYQISLMQLQKQFLNHSFKYLIFAYIGHLGIKPH